MTTIKPLTGGINLEVRHISDGGHALINVGPLPKPSRGGYVSEQWARYPVADLLAALGAVPRERAEAEDDAATAQAELRAATAERDALAATVARVREALAAVTPNADCEDAQAIVETVYAALDPKPAFVLPTEAGAGIEATKFTDDGEFTQELRLFGVGMWCDEDGEFYSPEGVMTRFTDHRMLDGAE